jgi:molybdate transport system substrate-binding protein
MDHVAETGALVPGTRVRVASNQLVMVVPRDSAAPQSPTDLVAHPGMKIALAIEAVPAGRYAEAALRHAGVWEALSSRDAGVVRTDDVRAALSWVARAEVDAAFVYATDAAVEPRVRTVHVFPPGSHPAVEYWAAVLVSTSDETRARALVKQLQSNGTVWRDAGFAGAQ